MSDNREKERLAAMEPTILENNGADVLKAVQEEAQRCVSMDEMSDEIRKVISDADRHLMVTDEAYLKKYYGPQEEVRLDTDIEKFNPYRK